jgi:hypothetical protein
LSCNSSDGSSIYAVEVTTIRQRTVIRGISTSYTIKETPGSITSVTFCAGFTVWTVNIIVAGSAGALSCNSSNSSSIYAEEVTTILQRTVIRRIGTSYTIKETPGGITAVTFCAGSTVWTANTFVSTGSARARLRNSANLPSIDAVKVSV